MRDRSGRWALTFNGEIYNYRALRESLVDRWNFRDASDTEVLLAGLVLEGTRFIDRLDGMWSFVLHDGQSDQWLLSRDRFGKKPLFYAGIGDAFACASELPALHALLPEIPWREDQASIADYLRYGYAMPGFTCVEGVHEVLPGHWMHVERDGRTHQQRYWNPDTSIWTGSRAAAAHRVRELLEAAVEKRQLAADVEVGAFLSGGVDSTVVCALANGQGGKTLRTFTAGFDEPTYDERDYAARAARWLGTSHLAETLSPARSAELAARVHCLTAQPFGDASIVPSTLVSAVAARHVKVVLTGDGGDEVFGGYARYIGRLARQRYRRVPGMLRRSIERIVRSTREPISHHSGSWLKRAHLFVALAQEDGDYVAPPSMRDDVLRMMAPDLGAGRPLPLSLLAEDADGEEVEHMLRMDWLIWLPQDILAKVDRATMENSLEARAPFLDRDLVEFALRLPWQWHFEGMRGKQLLKDAIGARIPDFVWKRRKQGFASPVAHWMRGALGSELDELCAQGDAGSVRASAVRSLLQTHRDGHADHGQALWGAYSYLQWRSALASAI
jgi:asparagine synthase (glutamine-hydrolysing)